MKTRNAFTLIELLVVIAIIGMLAALITAAGGAAINAAKQARIKMVMGQVELALEQYKAKYGEYPPDWSDEKAVLRHIKKRWPRYDFSKAISQNEPDQYKYFCAQVNCVTGWKTGWRLDPNNLAGGVTTDDGAKGSGYGTPMSFLGTLPFWFAGVPDNASINGAPANNNTFITLIGFSQDAENPLNIGTSGNRPTMETPIMELTKGKNLATIFADSAYGRVVPAIFSETGPIVYFRAETGQQDTSAYNVRNGNFLDLTANNPTVYYRVKNLWHHDVFPKDSAGDANLIKNGFGYDFDKGTVRFYPGIAVPYKMSATNQNSPNDPNNKWYNPKTYQLIHPGLDGKFGRWGTDNNTAYGYAIGSGWGSSAILGGNNAGAGVGQFDLDNIVNFGDGATIQSMLP